jgi:hypothetical protein
MKATLTFKNASTAKHFASYWAYKTSMGNDQSKVKSDGTREVTVYHVTPERKILIENYIKQINSV